MFCNYFPHKKIAPSGTEVIPSKPTIATGVEVGVGSATANVITGDIAVSSETVGIRDNFGIFDIPYKMILGLNSIHLFIYLSNLPTYLPTYLSIYLPIYLPTHLPTHPPTYLLYISYFIVYSFICLFIYSFLIYLVAYLYIYLFIYSIIFLCNICFTLYINTIFQFCFSLILVKSLIWRWAWEKEK